MLSGGRRIEPMLTHGQSRSFVYHNLIKVCQAIINHPSLAIRCNNSNGALQQRAIGFHERSDFDLFHYCTGAVDGFAISITMSQTRFYSGFCINNRIGIVRTAHVDTSSITDVDDDGVLVHDAWRLPRESHPTNSTRCALRKTILREIDEKKYYFNRGV
jgi:hypothetical protein